MQKYKNTKEESHKAEPAPNVQQLPGGTSAGVAAAARLSPLAWGSAVLSDADTAVWWETSTFKKKQRYSLKAKQKLQFPPLQEDF